MRVLSRLTALGLAPGSCRDLNRNSRYVEEHPVWCWPPFLRRCMGVQGPRCACGPSLFGRLEGLRLSEDKPAKIGGWAFRGLVNLPVIWDAQ